MPGLVGEMAVRRNAVDIDTHLLEFSMAVGQVFEFGRADKGEVGRIEHEHVPLACQAGFGQVNELAVVKGGGFERLDLGIDQGHVGFQ